MLYTEFLNSYYATRGWQNAFTIVRYEHDYITGMVILEYEKKKKK